MNPTTKLIGSDQPTGYGLRIPSVGIRRTSDEIQQSDYSSLEYLLGMLSSNFKALAHCIQGTENMTECNIFAIKYSIWKYQNCTIQLRVFPIKLRWITLIVIWDTAHIYCRNGNNLYQLSGENLVMLNIDIFSDFSMLYFIVKILYSIIYSNSPIRSYPCQNIS
jgi:hypothetical protein